MLALLLLAIPDITTPLALLALISVVLADIELVSVVAILASSLIAAAI